MAGFRKEDWEDLNITKEEVETLTQAFKKEEFRKLLKEYAEEITDPKNRKQYQDDIVQLEAERGIDCTFVNPEPGFVVKTSVDGNKKAFVNICKNKVIGRPSCKRELKDNAVGLSWSIPLCQSPNREDLDKKRKRCSVYDVVFHPDTLHLAEKNLQFKKLVIDTALNAVEDSYNVKLDKKNIKFPKIEYKGIPFATVIRKKSKVQTIMTEEDIEFNKAIKYPFRPPMESEPIVKNFETKKENLTQKYTTPKYIIKYRSGIDLQEFTYDKNAKINAAIPKELVIEINLPLLNSTSNVTLDIMKKSLHLLCEKPAKYKLDLQLPYSVSEETGNAKFDKDRRLLIIVLPVLKAKLTFKDLMREDSGVESDLSPVGSISNNEFGNIKEENPEMTLEDSFPLVKEDRDASNEEFKLSSEESEDEKNHHQTAKEEKFLDSEKHYLLPAYSCNLDEDKICFVLNVKNVNSDSLVQKTLNSHACHIKFFSIGSGFFPVHYAFLIDFKDKCNIQNVICDTWDNNVTVLVELIKSNQEINKYYVGLTEDSLIENTINLPLELQKMMEEVSLGGKEEQDANKKDSNLSVNIESANVNEVIISVTPEKAKDVDDEKKDDNNDDDNDNDNNDNDDDDDDNDDDDDDEKDNNKKNDAVLATSAPDVLSTCSKINEEKSRTLSESSADELALQPLTRKSILKKRICRSLSESNADDYVSSSVDKAVSDGSDLCVHEGHEEGSCNKKTVRFSDHIRQQLFRVNSSILGQRKKNKKKSRNKRRAMERRLSESENSEPEDKERDKKTKKSNKPKNNSLIKEMPKKEEKENCGVTEPVNAVDVLDEEKPKYGLKKDDKIFEFKSDLIFHLDI